MNMAREDVGDRRVVDVLPLNHPTVCPGVFDPLKQLVGNQLLVEPGHQIVWH